MSGETSLSKLLSGMHPSLNDGEYVFCSVPDLTALNGETPVGTFREVEGLTVIIERQTAQALGLDYGYTAAWITLTIHSALDAVGLTAAFASALAAAGISCNVIAGYFHDHIFVAHGDAQKAMAVLQALSHSDAQ